MPCAHGHTGSINSVCPVSYRDACFPGCNVSRTHITRDACFPSVINVSPTHAHFTRDTCFLDYSATLIAYIAITIVHINKDQVQIKQSSTVSIFNHKRALLQDL